MPRIVLASSSPYRQELLARLQLPFIAMAPEIDETAIESEAAADTAQRLALQKARAVAQHHQNAIIIGSDQVASLDGLHIGKPGNHAAALQQLQLMRGREVVFHTALCVIDQRDNHHTPATPVVLIDNIQTKVLFRNLDDEELDAFLRIEQPYDCAGSAKNEALGITVIEKISSDDPTALTGLPLIRLTSMLRSLGVSFYKK